MPVSAKKPKSGAANSDAKSKTKKGAKFEIVFDGPLLFVPSVVDGNITAIDVFSPPNGHPVGAAFLPETWFSEEELQDVECERWPEPRSFSLLDPHSYLIQISQGKAGKRDARPFAASGIPDTNHKIKPGRKLSSQWEIAISIQGKLTGWTSPRLANVAPGVFQGSDSPTGQTVALSQRLTFDGVTAVEFGGAPRAAKDYLAANVSKGGTLIILGEIYFQPSMRHEKKAIESLANLAGLDLHLITMAPPSGKSQLTSHALPCLHSMIVV